MKRMDFLNTVAKFAVKDYNRSKVLPSLTIAQGLLESGFGQSGLAIKANNMFGIKGKHEGQGMIFPTKEFINGQWITVNAEFRKYPNLEGSVKDHNDLLQKPRYSKVKGEKDYKKACFEIWKAGYATDPNYPQKLISIIEKFKLYEYDWSVAYVMKAVDANKIIKLVQREWANADEVNKKEWARIANELRKVSGQKPQ